MYTLRNGLAIEQTPHGIRVIGTHEHEFTVDGRPKLVIPRCSRGKSAEDCLADAHRENELARLAISQMSASDPRVAQHPWNDDNEIRSLEREVFDHAVSS